MTSFRFFGAALLAWGAAFAQAAGLDDVKKLLARPIITPDIPQKEVEDFCEAKVPRMPKLAAAQDWQAEAERLRRDVLEKIVFRGEAQNWRAAKCGVEWGDTIENLPGYRIKKLRYEALPGLWIPALLYEPQKLEGKVPVAMHVNGHDGNGKAAVYKQIRSINLAKRGMIVLNTEWLGMGQLKGPNYGHYKMNQLDLCGTSGLAPFFLAMQRGLELLLAHPNADPARVAVSGLSGGGWQTIFISSLDTRVTLANPVAGYSSFITRARHHSDLGDSEQTPSDLATVADYAHLTAMMAPRGLLLTYNIKDDCCFASGHALPPLLEAAEPVYKLFGQEERLRWHVNHDPGTHNFELDNREALYNFIGDQFFHGSDGYVKKEIDSAAEVKTYDELVVPLPQNNLDFNALARGLLPALPRDGGLPASSDELPAWQARRAKCLADCVKYRRYTLAAQRVGEAAEGETKAVMWRLRISDAWTVPAVELTRGHARGTTVLLASGGRAEAAEAAERLLAADQRVVAIDPFYFGESKIKSHDFLFGLLVAAVGERPLGIQASQTAAVARWLDQERKFGPVTVEALDERCSLFALAAAALEKSSLAAARLHNALGTLKEVVERNSAVDAAPEQFCFGLLAECDVPQMTALAVPNPVYFVHASDRAKSELAKLRQVYALAGKQFDPLVGGDAR